MLTEILQAEGADYCDRGSEGQAGPGAGVPGHRGGAAGGGQGAAESRAAGPLQASGGLRPQPQGQGVQTRYREEKRFIWPLAPIFLLIPNIQAKNLKI